MLLLDNKEWLGGDDVLNDSYGDKYSSRTVSVCICVRVCVCVSVCERDTHTGTGTKREKEKENLGQTREQLSEALMLQPW